MIIITGAYGFIGSHLVRELNARGYTDLILVDDLTRGEKFKNLLNAKFSEYYDPDEFFAEFNNWASVTAIYHQGAVVSTIETNGKLMLTKNYSFSRKLFEKAILWRIPVCYASSSTVYGNNTDSSVNPMNIYAYSKMLVDQYVQKHMEKFKLVHGWRYFSVYGNVDTIPGDNTSLVSKFIKQAKDTGVIELFEGSNDTLRDFICVDDLVKVVVNSIENNLKSGIRDLGTGKPISFVDLANLITKKYGGNVEFIPMPDEIKKGYQKISCAKVDFHFEFKTVEEYLSSK